MFCSNCGKEIPDNLKVCGYCGTPVQRNVKNVGNAGNTKGYSNQVNNDQQYYSGQPYNSNQQYSNVQQSYNNNQQYNNVQPYNSNQQYNNGQPNYNTPQQYNNGQGFNNQQNNSINNLKPDNKYNLVAALFTWIWALVKGMWDLAILDFLFTFIILIPIVGAIIGFIYFWVFRIAFVGRNANYYYRLKETQKILMFKAIQDPNLRRL